jgi:hypothetical protein
MMLVLAIDAEFQPEGQPGPSQHNGGAGRCAAASRRDASWSVAGLFNL